METEKNPWNVASIFQFTRTYFHCPECDYELENKQDFINHVSMKHTWVSDFLLSSFKVRCLKYTLGR